MFKKNMKVFAGSGSEGAPRAQALIRTQKEISELLLRKAVVQAAVS